MLLVGKEKIVYFHVKQYDEMPNMLEEKFGPIAYFTLRMEEGPMGKKSVNCMYIICIKYV